VKFIDRLDFGLTDTDGDGQMDYNESIDFKAERKGMNYEERNALAHSDRMHAMFARVDRNGDGKISLEEMLQAESPKGIYIPCGIKLKQ
jgi:Ca2+-binding EF-hand superfamily protein